MKLLDCHEGPMSLMPLWLLRLPGCSVNWIPVLSSSSLGFIFDQVLSFDQLMMMMMYQIIDTSSSSWLTVLRSSLTQTCWTQPELEVNIHNLTMLSDIFMRKDSDWSLQKPAKEPLTFASLAFWNRFFASSMLLKEAGAYYRCLPLLCHFPLSVLIVLCFSLPLIDSNGARCAHNAQAAFDCVLNWSVTNCSHRFIPHSPFVGAHAASFSSQKVILIVLSISVAALLWDHTSNYL